MFPRIAAPALTTRIAAPYSTASNEQHIKRSSLKGATDGDRFREFDLANRVYTITGGGRGLGLCMAEALMEAGAKGELS